MAAVEVHILSRINVGLSRIAQRIGMQSAESDDQNIGPLGLHLGEQIAAPLTAQIEQEQSGPVLRENGVKPGHLCDMPYLGQTAEIGARSPNEIGFLRIKNARGGCDHAAATSSWKRTRGRRM